jgi:hypothetical protein
MKVFVTGWTGAIGSHCHPVSVVWSEDTTGADARSVTGERAAARPTNPGRSRPTSIGYRSQHERRSGTLR